MNKELLAELNVRTTYTRGGRKDRWLGRNMQTLSEHAGMRLGKPCRCGVESGKGQEGLLQVHCSKKKTGGNLG